jgi:predicted DNA-binding transcriptional regulator YafY
MMFTAEEVEALVLGARIVASWADASLANSASGLLAKVEAVLPDHLRPRLERTALFAPKGLMPPLGLANLAAVRGAICKAQKIRFSYANSDGAHSERTVHPVGLFFWGSAWTLVAWCELREDFRSFRIDRIQSSVALEATFESVPGQTLEDFFRFVAATVGKQVKTIKEKVTI